MIDLWWSNTVTLGSVERVGKGRRAKKGSSLTQGRVVDQPTVTSDESVEL